VRVLTKEIEASHQRTQLARDLALGCKSILEQLQVELGSSRARNMLLLQEKTNLKLQVEQLQGQLQRHKYVPIKY